MHLKSTAKISHPIKIRFIGHMMCHNTVADGLKMEVFPIGYTNIRDRQEGKSTGK